MKQSVNKYAAGIEQGAYEAVRFYDGKKSGLIFDPDNERVPLDVLAFGAWQLGQGPFAFQSGEREYVLVPQKAKFRVALKGGPAFAGERGDPFTDDFSSNACAIYIPSGYDVELSGVGEMIFYSAPAKGRKAPRYIAPGEKKYVSRGLLSWRRDVITLVTPDETSTNLVVGETYSPPGLWSGTPLHVHDGGSPEQGESDHEEVYYHVMRYKGDPKVDESARIGPYGVQLLFDGHSLNKSYIVRDRTAVAIPGVCHPVVAAPVTDHIYGWGLAGNGETLGMRDMPEFRYMKDLEKAYKDLREGGAFNEVCTRYKFGQHERTMLRLMAREYGLELGA